MRRTISSVGSAALPPLGERPLFIGAPACRSTIASTKHVYKLAVWEYTENGFEAIAAVTGRLSARCVEGALGLI